MTINNLNYPLHTCRKQISFNGRPDAKFCKSSLKEAVKVIKGKPEAGTIESGIREAVKLVIPIMIKDAIIPGSSHGLPSILHAAQDITYWASWITLSAVEQLKMKKVSKLNVFNLFEQFKK